MAGLEVRDGKLDETVANHFADQIGSVDLSANRNGKNSETSGGKNQARHGLCILLAILIDQIMNVPVRKYCPHLPSLPLVSA